MFNKCYTNTAAYLTVFRKQRETLIALIIPSFDLLLALKIAVNSNCLVKEIEPHLRNDPQLRYGRPD